MGCHDDICGEWNDPPETHLGQCTPRRVKRDCGLTAVYPNESQTCIDECPEGSISEPISVTIGDGQVSSPFSTANANDLATVEACQQAAALRVLTPCIYGNTEQQCTNNCPVGLIGDPITVTVPTNTFTSTSQEVANALALAAACAQADALRLLNPCTIAPIEPETLVISCRERTMEAVLVGFDEFTDISDPPKKYLVETASGTSTDNLWAADIEPPFVQCDGEPDTLNISVYSGTAIFNPVTLAVVNTQQRIGTFSSEIPMQWGSLCPRVIGACYIGCFDTKTTSQYTDTGLCCGPTGTGFGTFTKFGGSSVMKVLSEEFTEQDAIDAAEFSEWSEWEECADVPCCESSRERDGFDLNITQGEAKVEATGLPPSTPINLVVQVWRENLVTLVDELAEQQVYEETTDGSGNATWEFQLPEVTGYRYYVESIIFSL